MHIDRINAPGHPIVRLIVAVVGNRKLNSMKQLCKCTHHVEDHILVVVFLDACKIEVGRKPTLAANDDLAKTGAALECEPLKKTAFREELQEKGQNDLSLRNHDVAKSRLPGVSLDLWLGQHR